MAKSKPINRNISEDLMAEQLDKAEESAKRRKLAKSKARAGRIKAEKR